MRFRSYSWIYQVKNRNFGVKFILNLFLKGCIRVICVIIYSKISEANY